MASKETSYIHRTLHHMPTEVSIPPHPLVQGTRTESVHQHNSRLCGKTNEEDVDRAMQVMRSVRNDGQYAIGDVQLVRFETLPDNTHENAKCQCRWDAIGNASGHRLAEIGTVGGMGCYGVCAVCVRCGCLVMVDVIADHYVNIPTPYWVNELGVRMLQNCSTYEIPDEGYCVECDG